MAGPRSSFLIIKFLISVAWTGVGRYDIKISLTFSMFSRPKIAKYNGIDDRRWTQQA